MKTQTISIIGLERLGASVGLAIKQSSLDVTILGNDRDITLAQKAETMRAIDKTHRNLAKTASLADILILAVPVSELELTMEIVGEAVQDHTLIIDLSGWKTAGLKWAQAFMKKGHYIGASLVLAASELEDGRLGLEAAHGDMFKNSIFCLAPSPQAEPKAVETAVNFGHLLGAIPYFIDPMEYDGLVQGIETVPGLLAAAMFNAVHKATGWRDMLRFASLPFALTTQPLTAGNDIATLALGNKMSTLRWLDALLSELQQMRRWVFDGEEELLGAMLLELHNHRSKWLHERTENNWVEIQSPEIEQTNIAGHMLGGIIPRRKKNEGSG